MKRIVLLTIALLGASPAWAVSECLGIGEPVPYAECVVAWENQSVRPRYPFPDLLNRLQAARLRLADQLGRGQVSGPEANREFRQIEADIYAEGNRRIGARYDSVIRHLDASAKRGVECLGLEFRGGISMLSCD